MSKTKRYKKDFKHFKDLMESFLEKCKRSISGKYNSLDDNEKNKIENGLNKYFLDYGEYFKDYMEVVMKEVEYLIPVSLILSSEKMNNMNIDYLKKYEFRGTRSIVRTNNKNEDIINKVFRLKIRDDEKNKNNNMDLARMFTGSKIIPLKTDKYYNKIYKKLLYERKDNYVPGNILIENLVQYICYKNNKKIVPEIKDIIFYKKVCKVKMEKVKGFELYKLLDENTIKNGDSKLSQMKSLFKMNFRGIMVYLFKELEVLQNKLKFIHGDLHNKNIIFDERSVKDGKVDINKSIKILDYEHSSVVLKMGDKLKFIKNYQDNDSFFEYNKYLNSGINPNIVKIRDTIKLFCSFLFVDSGRDFNNNSNKYKLDKDIEEIIINSLDIKEGYRERKEECQKYFIRYLESKKIEPYSIFEGKKHFQYYYEFMYMFVNLNYKLRNYIFFGVIELDSLQKMKDGKNPNNFTYNIFYKIINNNDNLIQPDFSKDKLSEKFICSSLISLLAPKQSAMS